MKESDLSYKKSKGIYVFLFKIYFLKNTTARFVVIFEVTRSQTLTLSLPFTNKDTWGKKGGLRFVPASGLATVTYTGSRQISSTF